MAWCVSDEGNAREQALAAPESEKTEKTLAQKGIVPSEAFSVHSFDL